MAALDRLMRSGSPREARDAVAAAPFLTDPFFSARLGQMADRLRQRGEVRYAESVEHWQGVLQRFRELGLQQAYLDFVIEDLSRAQTAEQHRRILRDNPDLRTPAATAYIRKRATESATALDMTAVAKYTMAAQIVGAVGVKDLKTGGAGLDSAISAFIVDFVRNPDAATNRRMLEARPELLKRPLSLIAGSMFQSDIAAARAGNDLVRLTSLLRRQRLFQRCLEVGVAKAFEELARGERWPEPGRR